MGQDGLARLFPPLLAPFLRPLLAPDLRNYVPDPFCCDCRFLQCALPQAFQAVAAFGASTPFRRRIGEPGSHQAFVLQAVCLLLVLGIGQISGGWFAFTLVLVYLTWGEIYSLFPATSADYFGTRHATSNYAVIYTAKGVASIIGAWAGALLYEQFGSWSVGFYGSAAMALVAAGIAWILKGQAAARRATVEASSTPAMAAVR